MSSLSEREPFAQIGNQAICFAPAKLNLSLHVTGVLPGVFHRLESLVAFCTIGDQITLEPEYNAEKADTNLVVTGPFADNVPEGNDNIISRAVEAFSKRYLPSSYPLKVTLEKNLPVASGIGGGSADAAATLLALYCLTRCGDIEGILEISADLGSDVPMCLHSSALIAKDRGENISKVHPFPELDLLLVNPGVAVSTSKVFQSLTNKNNPPMSALPENLDRSNLVNWLIDKRNDLENPAVSLAPEIADTLQAINKTHPLLSRMSGSGATCFGIYDTATAAQKAAQVIQIQHPNWWVAATKTRNFGFERVETKS